MKYINYPLLLCILLLFMGCMATTHLSSIKNPDIQNIRLHKLMVVAPFTDVGLRIDTERGFISAFKNCANYGMKVDCSGICSIDIIPPFKQYDNAEIEEKISNAGIDGILVVAIAGYWTSQSYIPEVSKETGEIKAYWNSLSYETYTTKSGGYYVSKPNVKFEMRLYDVISGEIIWMATSITSGNAFADYGTLISSLSISALGDLYNKGLIKK